MRLLPECIQRTYRGVTPPRTITAPHPSLPVYSMPTERERLAQFEYSKNFHKLRAQERTHGR